jgi:hypothetical protein
MNRYAVAFCDPRFDANMRLAQRKTKAMESASLREKFTLRVFSINSCLHCVTGDADVSLSCRQFFPRRNSKLPFDKINACYHFCHGMLDLKARVHFHEVESACFFQKKFNRPGASVGYRHGGVYRRLAHISPQGIC